MSDRWVLQTLISTGILQNLWKIRSPVVNASWRYTAAFYAGRYNKYFILPVITLFISIALEAGFIAYTIYKFLTDDINTQTIVIAIVMLFITAILLTIYLFCLIGRIIYGAVSQNLEDAGMLLLVLQKMLELKPVKIYTNSIPVKEHLQPMINADAFVFVEDEEIAQFKCINLDDVDSTFAEKHSKPGAFESTILYSTKGFQSLADDVKKIVGNTLVGDAVVNNENLYIQILTKVLNCGVNGLYPGKKPFRNLKLAS